MGRMSPPSGKKPRPPKLLYSRELPGGGYVTIQAELIAADQYHGWVSVERRSDRNRRDVVGVPIIAEAEGKSPEIIYGELLGIAKDNVAVARAIRQWDSQHEAAPAAGSDPPPRQKK